MTSFFICLAYALGLPLGPSMLPTYQGVVHMAENIPFCILHFLYSSLCWLALWTDARSYLWWILLQKARENWFLSAVQMSFPMDTEPYDNSRFCFWWHFLFLFIWNSHTDFCTRVGVAININSIWEFSIFCVSPSICHLFATLVIL